MLSKKYPQEKRNILVASPLEPVLDFVQGVPGSTLRPILQKLPPVPGFRVGHPNELQQKLRSFVQRIRKWTEADWEVFKVMWLGWIKFNPELDAALAEYDNSADFDGDVEKAPPNSELDFGCFEHLARASQRGLVSREQISKFYTFGYFVPDNRIDQIIETAKSESELKLPREVDELKNRLQEIVDSLRSSEKKIEVLHQDRDQVNAILQKLSAVEKLAKEAAKGTQQTNQLWEQRLKDLSADIATVRAEVKVASKTAAKSDQDISSELKQELDRVEHRLRFELVQVAEESAKGAETNAAILNDHLKTLSQEIASVSSDLAGLRAAEPSSILPVHVSSGSNGVRAAVSVDRLPVVADPEVLDTPFDVAKALEENFRAIGMKRTDARGFSIEVLGSLLAGQVTLLKGSTAPLISAMCARALAAEDTVRVSIPVGLLDSRDFGACLEGIIREADQRNRVTVLIIEGINLSALEAYAGRLRSLVSDRLFGLEPGGGGLLVLATVVDGCSALPLVSEHLDLGPVFDTDCLTWRDEWSQGLRAAGVIPLTAWKGWTQIPTEVRLHWGDLFDDCRLVIERIPVMMRRCLNVAARQIASLINPSKDALTVIESLAYGWLLPRALADGVDRSTLRQRLAEDRIPDLQLVGRIGALVGGPSEEESD